MEKIYLFLNISLTIKIKIPVTKLGLNFNCSVLYTLYITHTLYIMSGLLDYFCSCYHTVLSFWAFSNCMDIFYNILATWPITYIMYIIPYFHIRFNNIKRVTAFYWKKLAIEFQMRRQIPHINKVVMSELELFINIPSK